MEKLSLEIKTIKFADDIYSSTVLKLLCKFVRMQSPQHYQYLRHIFRSLTGNTSDWLENRPIYERMEITIHLDKILLYLWNKYMTIIVRNDRSIQIRFDEEWYIHCGHVVSLLNYMGERLRKITVNGGERVMTVAQLNTICSLYQIDDDYVYALWDKLGG